MDQSADYFLNELMSHMIYKRSENSQSQSWQIQIFDIEFIITEEGMKTLANTGIWEAETCKTVPFIFLLLPVELQW